MNRYRPSDCAAQVDEAASTRYCKRPYAMLIVPPDVDAGEDGWFAQIPHLPGCMTVGTSKEDALAISKDQVEGRAGVPTEQ